MRAANEARRPGLALSAYFYAHMPMLLGSSSPPPAWPNPSERA